MKKEELWRVLMDRNPSFKVGPVTMKPESLRKLFDLIWEQAQKDVPQRAPTNPFEAFLRGMK